jgi:hypothetical protein
MAGNVSKHVTLASEISRIVDERKLLEVAELEQVLSSSNDHGTQVFVWRRESSWNFLIFFFFSELERIYQI